VVPTNEFNLFASGFRGAQVYELSKRALAANAASVNGVLFDTSDPALRLDGAPGFTVWPAQSPAGLYDTAAGGTEFLLSSHAVFTGFDTRLRVWPVRGTGATDSASPTPVLSPRVASTQAYGIPPRSSQPAGNVPLRDCIADPACAPRVGSTVFNNPESRMPSNDSRMQQVVYAN